MSKVRLYSSILQSAENKRLLARVNLEKKKELCKIERKKSNNKHIKSIFTTESLSFRGLFPIFVGLNTNYYW